MTTSIRVGWPPSSTSRLVDRAIRRRMDLPIAAARAIRRHLHLLSGRLGRR